MCLATIN